MLRSDNAMVVHGGQVGALRSQYNTMVSGVSVSWSVVLHCHSGIVVSYLGLKTSEAYSLCCHHDQGFAIVSPFISSVIIGILNTSLSKQVTIAFSEVFEYSSFCKLFCLRIEGFSSPLVCLSLRPSVTS